MTPAQRERCFALLRSGGDLWAAVLELNALRRGRGDAPVVSYQELCRELTRAGPGCVGELSAVGARSILRRYSDAWFNANAARRGGTASARYPRRRRSLMPSRYYAGTFALEDVRLSLPTARGCPPLSRASRGAVPYPPETVRSVTLLNVGPKLFVDVTAEVPVATYGAVGPDPAWIAGVDLGIIHPYAVGCSRSGLVNLGPGHPGRAPASSGREESSVPGDGNPSPQTGSGGLAALAAVPGQDQAARGEPPTPGGPGHPRSGPRRGRFRRERAHRHLGGG